MYLLIFIYATTLVTKESLVMNFWNLNFGQMVCIYYCYNHMRSDIKCNLLVYRKSLFRHCVVVMLFLLILYDYYDYISCYIIFSFMLTCVLCITMLYSLLCLRVKTCTSLRKVTSYNVLIRTNTR